MKAIGIDIGGTGVKGAVIDGGKIIARTRVPTDISGGQGTILNSVFAVADKLLPLSDEGSPIGVGSAGDINPMTGSVIYATDNLPGFTGLALADIIKTHTGRETRVLNDATAALLGEMYFGAGKGKKDIVMLTLGTGLGAGIAIGGKPFLGSRCRAGRLGHITLYGEGRECTCGERGCSEQYVSATGLLKNAAQRGIFVSDCREVMSLAAGGDAKAAEAIDVFARDLHRMISVVVAAFDPEQIIIGGGLAEIRGEWWQYLEKYLTRSSRAIVRCAELGNDAGVIGAYCAANFEGVF